LSREPKRFRDDRSRRKTRDEEHHSRDRDYQQKKNYSPQSSYRRRPHDSRQKRYHDNRSSFRRQPSTRTQPKITLEEFLKKQNGYCGPGCPEHLFKCQKRALGRRRQDKNGNWKVECNFIEGEYCEGPNCQFAFCAKRKMRSDGKCSLLKETSNPQKSTWDDELDDDVDPSNSLKSFRFQDKIKKKIRHYDDFDDF